MSILKKRLAVLLTNSGLLAGIYLGNLFYYDVNKMWLNSFEKRTPVKEKYFQNIGDLKIFYEKVNGEFIPCYGLDDRKIAIGEDLLPKNFYTINNENVNEMSKKSIFELSDILSNSINLNQNNFTKKEKKELLQKIEQINYSLNPNFDKLNEQQIEYLNLLKEDFNLNDSIYILLKSIKNYNDPNTKNKEPIKKYINEFIR
jgi:hypothetical protein